MKLSPSLPKEFVFGLSKKVTYLVCKYLGVCKTSFLVYGVPCPISSWSVSADYFAFEFCYSLAGRYAELPLDVPSEEFYFEDFKFSDSGSSF